MDDHIQLIMNETSGAIPPKFTEYMSLEKSLKALKFHRSIPQYKPSPLISLRELSKKLGIDSILIKDESHRYHLNSFKILGASYAIAKVIDSMSPEKHSVVTFDNLAAEREKLKSVTFVTATDGNHGFAVGWFTGKIGCRAVIAVPAGTSGTRIKEIESTGATVSVVEGNYDDAVLTAQKIARKNNWILVQDSSWQGYKKIPAHIMQGYTTILNEFMFQEENIWPTHIFVQAGVGSLAASLLSFLHEYQQRPIPFFVVVEPIGAPCFFHSIKISDHQPHRFHGTLDTIMTGLSCGQPSLLAWNILHSAASGFIQCSDRIASLGMEIYANPLGNDPPIHSGASGAVTMGVIHEILTNGKYTGLKEKLRLNRESRILLISTEGPAHTPEHPSAAMSGTRASP